LISIINPRFQEDILIFCPSNLFLKKRHAFWYTISIFHIFPPKELVVKILLDNNYSLKFIFYSILDRIRYLIVNNFNKHTVTYQIHWMKMIVLDLLFLMLISGKFKNDTKDLDIKLSFYITSISYKSY